MLLFLLKRLAALVPVLLGVSFLVFLMVELAPGDVTTLLLGPLASEEAKATLRKTLGLDQPILIQYAKWLEHVLGGDFGVSIATSRRVVDLLAPRLLGYLTRQTRDEPRAEDLVQQTLLRIHRARGRFIPGAAVVPWAMAIARRLMIDDLRHRRGDQLVRSIEDDGAAEVPDKAPTAVELVEAGQLGLRIRVELAKLPDAQREAFELVKQEGILFKHLLRMILLCEELSQLTPKDSAPADWEFRLRDISSVLTTTCRTVDPQSTDEMLEEMAEEVS